MTTQSLRDGDFGAVSVDYRRRTPHEPGLIHRFFKWLTVTWAKKQAYRQTIADLRRLSDRELNDIGLSRAQIELMVKQSTHEQG